MAVVQSGFSESLYKTALPVAPAAITIDPTAGNLYYADDGNMNGVLRKVAADFSRTLTTVTSDFTPPTVPGFFPYVATDIQYHNGSVFTVISDDSVGQLVRINLATGQTSALQAISGAGFEAGVDVVATQNSLYFTDGTGSANSLFRFNLTTGGVTTVATNLPAGSFGLELNPADGKLYFAHQGGGFFRVDESATGPAIITQISSQPTGNGNFAIDPLGEYIYVRVNGNINRISLATGVADVFATGLDTNNTRDLAFGPASNGFGYSLYAGNFNTLLEYSGFSNTTEPPQPGEIHGTKWEDVNGNGVRETGEPVLANVVVYLDANRNGQLNAGELQTTTDASGSYRFENVQSGRYVVREVVPAGFLQTSPGAGRDFFYGWDISQGAVVTIDGLTGQVTTIMSTNGIPMHGLAQTNAGELYGISGFNDSLYRIDAESGTTTFVGFSGVQLAFGLAYDAQEDVLYGLATPPNQSTAFVQLVEINRANGQVNFLGATATSGLTATSGITFDAVNRRVLAFDDADDEVYAFNLQSGQGSRLSFARPSLATSGLSQDGAGNLVFQTGAFLGRLNPTTGQHAPYLPLSRFASLHSLEMVDFEEFGYRVEVGSGAVVTGIDFGNQSMFSTVSGNQWDDLDGDGVRDEGEPALTSVVVYLDSNNNSLLDAGEPQTLTGGDGSYTFTGLLPGHYTVREVLPQNYQQTSPGAQKDYFWSYDTIKNRIAKIDASTGAVTPIGNPGSIGINADIHGLAFTNSGELYGMSGNTNSLYRFDTTTGQATQIRGSGMVLAWGLAYDSQTDTIYGLATPPGFTSGNVQPVIFNRETGGATLVGSQITTGLTGTSGIAFDSVSRRLIAFDNADDEVYAFHLSTGAGTRLGFSGSFLNAGAMADDGAGSVILPTGSGLVKMNLATRQVTPLTGPLTGVSIEALEYVNRDDYAHKLYVGPAEAITGINFGNQNVLGSISGTKWEDLDGDGVRDASEPALANVVVYLDLNRDGDLDVGERQTTTDASGAYVFDDVLPGQYLVREVLSPNYHQTSPGVQRDYLWGFDWQNRRLVKIDAVTGLVTPIGAPGSIVVNNNLHGLVQTNDGILYGISGVNGDNGLYRINITTGMATRIGSTGAVLAWGLAYDESTDTIYGAATAPAGPSGNLQLITIDRNTGAATFVGTQTSNPFIISSTTGLTFDPVTRKVLLHERNTGRFFSIDPATGNFTLQSTRSFGTNAMAADGTGQVIVQPQSNLLVRYNPLNGATSTFLALSTSVNLDSLELIDFTDFAHEVFVGAAQHVSGLDFGNQNVVGSISGTKWEDLDGDGIRDAGEPAMAGVVVYLDANRNGNLDAEEQQTTTDSDGAYIFEQVFPGHYLVREVLPANYQQTSPGVERDYLWGFDWQNRRLVKIDAVTGLVTPIGPAGSIGVNNNMHGLVQTSDGSLYGISGVNGDNGLYQINSTTGQATRIGSTGVTLAWGLAYDESTDTIYGAATPPGASSGSLQLITIDRHSGAVTFIGTPPTPNSLNIFSTTGMTFDPVTRQVLLHDRNSGQFFSIDPSTGVFTLKSMRWFGTNAMAADGTGQVIVQQGSTLLRYNPQHGATSTFLVMSTFVNLDSLELIDLTDFAHEVLVEPAQHVTGRDFGNQSILGDLSGQKFEDLDGDGARDPGEPAMANMVVYLDANNNGQLDSGELQTTTDAAGDYAFNDILPGSYVVREVLPNGYEQTSPGMQRDFLYAMDSFSRRVVKIDAITGQVTPLSAFYGSVLLQGIVRAGSGQVFGLGTDNALYSVDPLTGAGTRIGSTGRPSLARGLAYERSTNTLYGLADMGSGQIGLVTFDPSTGLATNVGASTVQGNHFGIGGLTFDPVSGEVWAIDSNFGRYLAFNTSTGIAREVRPGPFFFASGLANDGKGNLLVITGTTLQRIKPNTGETFPILSTSQFMGIQALELVNFDDFAHQVYLPPAGSQTDLNFGNRSLFSTLSGANFKDRNGDGIRQADEVGFAGLTVYLDLNGDEQFSPHEPSTVTAEDGTYSFTNLLPGRYVVREVVPEGYAQTPLTELEDYFLGYDSSTNSLVTINPATGEVATKTALFGNPATLHGVVRTNSNEVFTLSGHSNTLYSVNSTTGQVTAVGSAQRRVAWGLAYDAATDTIYGLAHPGSDLEVIALARYDRTTGEAIIIGEPLTGVRFTSGLTFDPVRRKVIAFDNSAERELYAFDPETGAAELLSVVTPPVSGFGLVMDNAGYLILPAGPSVFIRVDPATGDWSQHLSLSRGVVLEALEFVDFADGGHDVYLSPRTSYVGYDIGNQNVAPSNLQLTLAESVVEGSSFELTGTFVDPGSFENHTIEIAWGDGTVEQMILAPGVRSFSASYTYEDDNPTSTASDPYNVSVRVLDSDASVVEAEQSIEVQNVAPSQVLITAASSVSENDQASLHVAFVDPGLRDTYTVTVDWGDGFAQEIALTADVRNFTRTHQYLDDPEPGDNYVITISIEDDDQGLAVATRDIAVLNIAPEVDPVEGPTAAVRGQSIVLTSGFTDPGSHDKHEVSWDFGDGTILSGPASPGGLSIDHVYTETGVYTVTLTVQDEDGGISTQTFQIEIDVASLQADPLYPSAQTFMMARTAASNSSGQQMLVVGGTTGNDIIRVVELADGLVEPFVNGESLGVYSPTTRIVVYGQDGDDEISMQGSLSAWLYGGLGNDVLEAGAGDDLLFGEAGDDHLTGASGYDLLIGGSGADRLVGSSDGDILISGYLVNQTERALADVMTTWNSLSDYQDRIAALSAVLNEQTIRDDDAADKLTGASGLDWYFAQLDGDEGAERDTITGSLAGEEMVDLDLIFAE